MVWSELSTTVSRAMRDFPPPALILIHLGSNDIGTIKTVKLFPNCRIIWSELLEKILA